MRIAFFGAGNGFAFPALTAIADLGELVAVVRPAARPGRAWARRIRAWIGGHAGPWAGRARDPVTAFAARRGVPCWDADPRHPALAARLAVIAPDLICVAGFSWLLPPSVYGLARLGTVNLHASLLPRHRGPAPHIWIYREDDREAGVTVHRVEAAADTGPILAQDAFPLPRGLPVVELQRRCAERGAALLAATVQAVAAGRVEGRPQENAAATYAPRVRPGTALVDHATWDVERVWHFLTGLTPHWREPLRDARARAVQYRGVAGYARERHDRTPGVVERTREGAVLFSRGGIVRLA